MKVVIEGYNIYVRYRPGSSDQFICFLHGYPTSSLDYEHLIAHIPSDFHVVAHDHLGFGMSDKPIEHNYELSAQADYALALYKILGAGTLHLVAHDYGTSVVTEIIARHNEGLEGFDIRSVTLCNGSMLIEMAKLRLIQRLLKSRLLGGLVSSLSSAATFHRNMKNIWYDREAYDMAAMHTHWDLLIANNGRTVLPKITRYIDQRYTYYERWIGGLKYSSLPYHILWATHDPVAVVAMAHKLDDLIQNSTLHLIEDCGHYPMIEKAEEWLERVVKFIQSNV